MKLICRLIILSLLVIIVSCNSNKQIVKIYSVKGCDTNFEVRNIGAIIDSKFVGDQQRIEVTGYISWGTEEFALGTSANGKSKKSMIWINFRNSLVDSLEFNAPPDVSIFQKLNGKKVTVRGIYKANEHGHLEQYAASIDDICFLKIW